MKGESWVDDGEEAGKGLLKAGLVVPTGRLRQEDCLELEVSLDSTVNSRPANLMYSVSKQSNKTNQQWQQEKWMELSM